jgi:hypothetical protein
VIERRGALEALERVLNRGGEPDEVLQEVVAVLGRLYNRVAVRVIRDEELVDGPSSGNPLGTSSSWDVYLAETKVGEIEVGPASDEDDAFMTRVATIVSPYFRAG